MVKYAQFSPEWYAENRSGPLWRTCIAFIVLQTAFVCLFLKARHLKRTLWTIDVWFILLGYAWSLMVATAALCMISNGLGRHMIPVIQESYPEFVTGLKFMLVQQFSYVYAVTFPKLAILFLYLRLFDIPLYRRMTYAIGAIVVASAVALTITTFLICRPFAANWNKLIPGGRCGDLGLLFKLVSLPNLLTDLGILFLPIPIILKLQMAKSQKIGLILTFLLGSCGILTAVLRLYYFSTVRNLFADVTYDHVVTECWTIIEPSFYLIAAILPSCRPLLTSVRGSSVYRSFKSRLTESSSWQDSDPTVAYRTTSDASCTQVIGKSENPPKITVLQELIVEHPSGHDFDFDLADKSEAWAFR